MLFRVVNRSVGNRQPSAMPGVLAEPGISPPQLELPGMFTEKSGVSDCSVAASRIRELTSPLRFRRNDFAAIFLVERSRPETITRHIRVAIARELVLLPGVFLPRLGPPNPGGPFLRTELFVTSRRQALAGCASAAGITAAHGQDQKDMPQLASRNASQSPRRADIRPLFDGRRRCNQSVTSLRQG